MNTELIIQTQPAAISANFDAIKQELKLTLESYDLIITEQTLKGGKSAAAELNKMKKVIKDRERAALDIALAPVEGFRDKVKELVTLVEEAREKIAKQLDIYTQRTLESIREQIAEHVDSQIKYHGLREPFTIIEQEDLVLLGSRTKTGNLTKKTLDTIQERLHVRKDQQEEEDEKIRLAKEAEEARIAAEVEKRAEQARIDEERKAKARADEEMKRREEAIRSDERELERKAAAERKRQDDIAAADYAKAHPQYDHDEQMAAESVCAKASRPVVPYIPDTPEIRAAAQTEINQEIEDHEMGVQAPATPQPIPTPTPEAVTPQAVQPGRAISVFFEMKIDAGNSTPEEVAAFTLKWIYDHSIELGSEVERIGVTTQEGIKWIKQP